MPTMLREYIKALRGVIARQAICFPDSNQDESLRTYITKWPVSISLPEPSCAVMLEIAQGEGRP